MPVVGQVVMVGTGLFLAGDYIYHHWDQISNFTTKTLPHLADDAGHAITHGLSDAGHAVSSVFHHLF